MAGDVPQTDSRIDLEDTLRPPETLFHYTSSAGLRGILETGHIWATDLDFLNDERELRYGLDLLLPLLRTHVLGRSESRLARAILDVLGNTPGTRHFVACFCERGDLLSQWRGYGTPGGYSLGVRTNRYSLADAPNFERPVYQRVWYDPQDAKGFADAWADMASQGFIEKFSSVIDVEGQGRREIDDDDLAERLYKFDIEHYWHLERLCAVLKDPSFAEEREWRILRSTHMGFRRSPEIHFREGSLGLTPYALVDLRDESGLVPVSEVIVGPGPHARLRLSAVQLLLEKLGYSRDIVVRSSDVPFRP
ncbi:DUF2971 domain-containing protein [Blastococcus sp. LR1]|uniref:DUF2971 domain-containing protein n=1 Tax=Blastococcus sp. LR1 TaxID=2877000 RepID=UPI001CCF8891|nr:DUF2971 domain-containing protein [Blastococcus sp. LR1]MCA0144367.1 DUF2971 domain-containing protein [Blastococcus sp. LR1]